VILFLLLECLRLDLIECNLPFSEVADPLPFIDR
jgi:hypothetical protein